MIDLDDVCENCRKYYSPGCVRCQERQAEYCGCGQINGCLDGLDEADDNTGEDNEA